MVSFRRLALALLPLLNPSYVPHFFPAILSTLSQTPDSDAPVFSAEPEYAQIATAAEALEREGYIRSTLEARPEQGGCRITQEWLEGLSQRDCLWQFRCVCLLLHHLLILHFHSFTAGELIELAEVLKLPPIIKTQSRYRTTPVEALSLTCARLARAGDLYDLVTRYDHSESAISEIVNYTVCAIDITWARLLDFNHTHLLSPSNLAMYAAAIHAAGAPLATVWGFIDCTLRHIARPSRYQEAAYNGYKKFHALKYQAVAIPNGMIAHLFGPWEGRNADPFLLTESRLIEKCAEYANRENTDETMPWEDRCYQLFGDPAYGLSSHLVSPFSGAGVRSETENAWNTRMASVRIKVEHTFGGVVNNWPFLNAFWKQRVYSSPVGRYYRVAVLLTNALNCFRPNQVALSFDCPPPTLDEYFHS